MVLTLLCPSRLRTESHCLGQAAWHTASALRLNCLCISVSGFVAWSGYRFAKRKKALSFKSHMTMT